MADLDETSARHLAESINAEGGTAISLPVDVAEPAAAQRLIDQTQARFGKLDILVNNAGIGLNKPFLSTTLEEWELQLRVNLTGQFLCGQAAARCMLSQKSGRIVNVASIFGIRGFRNQPAYVASKHGVVGLTKAAALEYATSGLRINVICPGAVRTPMVDRMLEDAPDMEAALTAMHPVGRLGAILGPSMAAVLVAQQWSPQQLLWAAAVPAAVSTIVVLTLWAVLGRAPKSADAASPVATLAQLYGSRYTLAGPAFEDAAALLGGGAALGWLGAWISASRHLRSIEPRA